MTTENSFLCPSAVRGPTPHTFSPTSAGSGPCSMPHPCAARYEARAWARAARSTAHPSGGTPARWRHVLCARTISSVCARVRPSPAARAPQPATPSAHGPPAATSTDTTNADRTRADVVIVVHPACGTPRSPLPTGHDHRPLGLTRPSVTAARECDRCRAELRRRRGGERSGPCNPRPDASPAPPR